MLRFLQTKKMQMSVSCLGWDMNLVNEYIKKHEMGLHKPNRCEHEM